MRIKINRVFIAWLMTFVWIFLCGAYFYFKWDDLFALKPNELGDFLAGTFAPLAFLWLVIGYFQQGEELRQNTSALELQARELQRSVEQQRTIAAVSLQELDHIKSQANMLYKQEKRKAAPALSCTSIEYRGTFETGQYVSREYKLTFKNHGSQVWDVSGSVDNSGRIDEQDALSELKHEKIPYWNNNDSIEFTFSLPMKADRASPIHERTTLMFTYKDHLDEWEQSFFHSKIKWDGHISGFELIDKSKYM